MVIGRWLWLGIGAVLLPPLVVTVLAFQTLAAVDPADLVIGTPLVITPTPDDGRIPELRAGDPQPLFQAAVMAYREGNFATAAAYFRAAAALLPDEAALWNGLGLSLSAQNQIEPAAAAFREALRLDPQMAEAQFNLGSLYQAAGDFAAAAAAFEAALAVDPSLAAAHVALGALAHEQGELARAAAAFEQALALDPDSLEAAFNLAVVRAGQGDTDRAVALLEAAAGRHSGEAGVYYQLGLFYRARREPTRAREAFSRAVELGKESETGRLAAEQLALEETPAP